MAKTTKVTKPKGQAAPEQKATPTATVEDPTQLATATTKKAVDDQDARSRLWQSLEQSYAAEQKESDAAYDRAIAQQDLQATSKGMGRSSFNLATQANLLAKKAEARAGIKDKLIAAYQSGVSQIEQQEKEDERWERQYADSRADTKWSQGIQEQQIAYQKERDAVSDALEREKIDYQKSRDEISDAFQREQWEESVRQFKEKYEYQRMTDKQKIAFQVITGSLESGDAVSDDVLKDAGISRADYEQMKEGNATVAGTSGTGGPTWTQLAAEIGIDAATYKQLRQSGMTHAQIKEKYGKGGTPGDEVSDGAFESGLGGTKGKVGGIVKKIGLKPDSRSGDIYDDIKK